MRCGRSSKTGSYSSSSSTHHCSCCVLSQNYPQHFPEAFSEPFSECQQGYGSDSSCNSSDGVLVNFSAIYNKMNNGGPEKPALSGHTNLNSSTDHSCTSSVSDPSGNRQDSTKGAFYLDLHTSPTEPPSLQQQPPCLGSTFPLIREPNLSTSSTCSCALEHQGALDLDANCNSYHPPHSGSSGDLSSCLQSQARLVVATQNYYKLVTCDLSSQSSPSPAGSSVNSCSDEHSKGSPTPTQPSEYYLFRQRADEGGVEEEDEGGESLRVSGESERKSSWAKYLMKYCSVIFRLSTRWLGWSDAFWLKCFIFEEFWSFSNKSTYLVSAPNLRFGGIKTFQTVLHHLRHIKSSHF